MWPRRTTSQAKPSAAMRHVEKRPLLAAEPVDDGPLVAGCGKTIGVKAQGMGYVVIDSPTAIAKQRRQSQPRRPGAPPSALQQWGAVAAALVASLVGKGEVQATPKPDG